MTAPHWRVGDVRITKVLEVEAPGLRFVVPDAKPENLLPIDWLRPDYVSPDGDALGSIHALVIEAGSRRILVDTCIGNDKRRGIPTWNMRSGPFLEDLAAAGFPTESIDTVVCTHLHVDHVGWNTRWDGGRWVPTFTNARTIVAQTEWEYWEREAEGETLTVIQDSVEPLFEAQLVDLVPTQYELAPGIELVPTPGHTPGHVSVVIHSAGEQAVITGDMIHHPSQFHHPEWTSPYDSDRACAHATRTKFIDEHAGTPTLIVGTHFSGPTAGHLVQAGDHHQLVAAPPDVT